MSGASRSAENSTANAPSSPALFNPPPGYDRVRVVRSFAELVGTRFADGVNALCWPRVLPGGFAEVVAQLANETDAADGITSLDEAVLRDLRLSPEGRNAVEFMLADLKLLSDHGLAPNLDYIRSYPRDDAADPLPTHVYSFHADSAPVEADTFLCTYHGAASEGVRNDEARQRTEIPELRAELLHRFGGKDDDEFATYLQENCHDLHYVLAPGAHPFSFGVGPLWRITVDYPGSPVPPCIHRAPANLPGQPPRLLLIS
jgi:hypothetical protein